MRNSMRSILLSYIFGQTDGLKDTRVYAVIFPSSFSKNLAVNFREDKVACFKIEDVYEFNINSFELKSLNWSLIQANK